MVGQIALTVLVTPLLLFAVFGKGRARRNWEVIKTYRPIPFITNLPVITVMCFAIWALVTYVPYMKKNPILWLFSLVFGSSGNGTGNMALAGFQWKWYVAIMLPLILFGLPHFAELEEKVFREGTKDWRDGIFRSIGFGLTHITAFIPIGAALAITIMGLWFTHQYFKGGVERSTRYHAICNTTMFTFAGVLALIIF